MQKKLIDKTKLRKNSLCKKNWRLKLISKTKSQSTLFEALNRTNNRSDKLLSLA